MSLVIPSLPFSSFPPRLLITILSCPLLSFPLFLKFLRIVFPPSSFLLSQLLSVSLSISSFLFSRFLLGHLVSLQSRLLSCPTSFPLGLHFLRVRIPPSLFPFSQLLWVGLSPFSFLFSHFLWVGLSPFSLPFSHFLWVGLILFPQFLPVFLPPFSFLLSHFLWVGFLPLPVSFPLSTFRFLYPLRLLSSSIGTRLALNVTCRCLPPLKSIDIHLTLSTGQRGQHHTQVSNTLPFSPSFSSLRIQSLPILVGHRDKIHTHP